MISTLGSLYSSGKMNTLYRQFWQLSDSKIQCRTANMFVLSTEELFFFFQMKQFIKHRKTNAHGAATWVLGVSVEKTAPSTCPFRTFSLDPPSGTEIKCEQYKDLENQVSSQRKFLPNGFWEDTVRLALPFRVRAHCGGC